MYWCFHCYGVNTADCGPCSRCGRPIEGPPGLSYDERLIWTLGHPDADRAITAARILGVRRARISVPALRRLVTSSPDPYLAAEALRSVIAIEGAAGSQAWLDQLAESGSAMLRQVAHELGREAAAGCRSGRLGTLDDER